MDSETAANALLGVALVLSVLLFWASRRWAAWMERALTAEERLRQREKEL